MKIGNYNLHTIETGRFRLDGGAMFGIIPKSLWSKQIPSDDYNRVELALRCLLVKGNGKNILIDCGIGTKFPEKEKNIFAIDHSKYNIDNSLKDFGLTKEDITHVILTHFHFDHAGGATECDDNNLKPTFPNAIYYIQRKNLDWAINPTDKDKGSYLKDNIQPLLDQNKLRILGGKTELFPNIQVMVYNGHTIGLQAVKISDKDKTILYCADVIPTSSHLLPHWVMAYDLYPLASIEEKKQILSKASEKGWILFFEHDPEIEACTVEQTDKGYKVKDKVTLH